MEFLIQLLLHKTATFTTGAGCDSVVTLNLTVSPAITNTISPNICAGTSYTFNGISYSASTTQTATFTTGAGCDSVVTLNLTVSPAITNTISPTICAGTSYTFNGTSYSASTTQTATFTTGAGCDSVVTLNLTVSPAITTTLSPTICSGASYSFNGNSYNGSGTYTGTFTTASGCDSTVTVNLTVANPITNTIAASICQGLSYAFNGNNYTTGGTYTGFFTTGAGCDSVVTLNLTVNPAYAQNIFDTICQGSTYLYNGNTYITGGSYANTFTTGSSCDSIVTLNLTVNPASFDTISAAICPGNSYAFGGTNYTAAGTYTQTFTSAAGCDSVVTLDLSISPNSSSAFTASICQGANYTFNGTTYNSTGTYIAVFPGANTCDSTVTLSLTVNAPISDTLVASTCTGTPFTYNGNSYSITGNYPNIFTGANSCDSTVVVKLTVNPVYNNTASATICSNQTYSFGGTSYNASGTYSNTFTSSKGCDSVVTLTLTVNPSPASSFTASICAGQSYAYNGNTYTATGNYANTFQTGLACDSVVTLVLTVNPIKYKTVNTNICQGANYFFNGAALSTTGTYYDTLVSAAGCDSIVTLNLTVNPPITKTLTASTCADAPYLFNGILRDTSGIYVATYTTAGGCDSVVTLTLTVKPLPAAPITVDRTYCVGDPVTPLSAVGTSISWYTTPTGSSSVTTPTPSTANPGVTTWYAAQTLNGCIGPRAPLVVSVSTVPGPPTVSTPLIYCQGDQGDTLTATGTGYPLVWYTMAVAGDTLLSSPFIDPATTDTITYYVGQVNNGCASTRVALDIEVRATPLAPTVTTPITYCQFEPADTIQAVGTGLQFYTQAVGGLFQLTPPTPSTLQPGTFSYYVSQGLNGCESPRVEVVISVIPKPAPPQVTVNNFYCVGTPAVTLTAVGQNLLWYTTATGGVGDSIAPVIPNTAPLTVDYYVSQDVGGCRSDRTLLHVEVVETPTAGIGFSKNPACEFDTVKLTYIGSAPTGSNFNWTLPGANVVAGNASTGGPLTLYYLGSGVRTATVQVEYKGCVSQIATATLTIKPTAGANFALQQNVCVGDEVVIALNQIQSADVQYAYDFDGGVVRYGVEAGPYGVTWDTAGLKTVILQAFLDGCPSLPIKKDIHVRPLAQAKILSVENANPQQVGICNYDTLQAVALGQAGYIYEWGPANFVVDSNRRDSLADIILPFTSYLTLHTTNYWGCGTSDSVLLTARPCCEIVLPTAFTPNGDGRNDVMRAIATGRYDVEYMRIVNRWGQVVYESRQNGQGWDGIYNGEPQDMDTYYYVVRYKCLGGGVMEKKGEFILVR